MKRKPTAYRIVMRGLDPSVDPLRQTGLSGRWIAGSSPAMTSELP